jgi:V/A-type H+-transporting ATPase subunit E
MNGAQVTEAGVDALVERLHRDGVDAGRQEAARLVDTAKQDAARIIATAQAERDLLLTEARQKVDALRRSSQAALDLALRDVTLKLRETLAQLLAERLGARVRAALDDPALVAELIGHAARALTGAGEASAEVGPHDAMADKLGQLADLLARDLADAAPTLRLGDGAAGVVLRRAGADVAIDLTDETVTALLFTQLQPRFRRIFEGGRP